MNKVSRDNYLISEEYATSKTYWRKRHSYYHTELDKYFKSLIKPDSKVLEIGCGEGDSLAFINPSFAVGIERNPYLINKARNKYPTIKFIEGDIEDEKIKLDLHALNLTFDYIILSDLIGTLKDIQLTFENLHIVSGQGTKIIVTYYNYFWNPILKIAEALRLKLKEGIMNWLYIDEIKNLLLLTDFLPIAVDYLMLFPINVPLISTIVNKYFSQLPIIRRFCISGIVTGKFATPAEKAEDYSVSVIIPCRNEAGNIDEIIKRIPDFGKQLEIIFVEGNSSDNTYETIEAAIKKHPNRHIRLFKQRGKGKGNAVRLGFEKAKGEVLIILDADMTVAPEDITKFYKALKNKKGEFINGSRLVYQMDENAMRTLNKLGNIFFSKVFTWLLGQRITDTLCGTKALFKKDYDRIAKNRNFFGDFDPFGDFDLLFGAAKLKLKIIEIPIRYGERKYGTTNINRFRDGWLLTKMCFIAFIKIKLGKPLE
ncbi:MAG: glycosyltransferase [Ignavibacteria bacterium]